MRAVFQRVSRARVTVDGREVSSIGLGAMVLLGVGKEDAESDAAYMAEKVAGLRVFPDGDGKMNLSLLDVEGEVLLVSQFTLYGDVKKGKRPGFDGAAPPDLGEKLYLTVAERLREMGVPTKTGVFGAHMMVELTNDGPVTILISSKKEF
ncbi:MAG: D-aminoacyl-tRNA deacylase [Bacillota bacterium]